MATERPQTRLDALEVILVGPSSWSPDGAANLRAAHDELRRLGPLTDRHVVVLPELIGSSTDESTYLAGLRAITTVTGAWVIGGSHYRQEPVTNAGIVLAPDGTVADHYEKRHPYGTEHDLGVRPGNRHADCHIAGWLVSVMICADAWYADHLIKSPIKPDLLVIPSFSTTRRPPQFARKLWHHLAIARAYEFATYVALADWRPGTTQRGMPCAGTSGMADPAPTDPDAYFIPAADHAISAHQLQMTKLRELRNDRATRRFTPHHASS